MSETIFEAMGLTDNWGKMSHDSVEKIFEAEPLISDVMLKSMANVRDESLGIKPNSDIPLTEYERKLVVTGFFIGKFMGAKLANGILSHIMKKIKDDD